MLSSGESPEWRFKPLLTDPESAVLQLDEPPIPQRRRVTGQPFSPHTGATEGPFDRLRATLRINIL
jgi:hypothetical protein